MSYQQKLARKVSNYQRKVQDLLVEQLGTEQSLVRLETTSDKYKDRTITLLSDEIITGIINYPNNEIPMTFGTTNTDSTSHGLHLYDLLPIEGHFKFNTELNFGDIIIQKIKTNVNGTDELSSNFRLIALQVVDLLSKASVEVIYKKYELAPYTLQVSEVTGLQAIIDNYLDEPW